MSKTAVSLTVSCLVLCCALLAAPEGYAGSKNYKLVIYPSMVKVMAGKQIQYSAIVVHKTYGIAYSPTNIIWKASGGTITETGLFTAGSEPGKFCISAQAFLAAPDDVKAACFVNVVGLSYRPKPVLKKTRRLYLK